MKRRFLACVLALLICLPIPARALNTEELISLYQGWTADSQQALDRPNRSISELSVWLSDIVAQSLNFTPGQAGRRLNDVRGKFSDQGYRAYMEFMTKQGMSGALQGQTLNLSTIVNSTPLLIGQGASAGRYAWAFELPVVLSITTGPDTPVLNRTVTLRIQMGRSAKSTEEIGVLIENWQEFVEAPLKNGNAGAPSGQTGASKAQTQMPGQMPGQIPGMQAPTQ